MREANLKLPELPATPDLPISSFFMVPVTVPKKAITGFDGKETRAVSIADCRRYAESYAQACLAAHGVPAVNAAQWPDARNRGLLQAAKQALRALEQHARLPWGQPEYPAPNPGAHFIYEAESYLRPAIEREEAFRSAIGAPEAVARGVAKPYAYEFGRSNGDGTYSVVIDRGSMVQVDTNRYEFGPPRDPHPDHPVRPLYEHPNTAGVTEDRK